MNKIISFAIVLVGLGALILWGVSGRNTESEVFELGGSHPARVEGAVTGSLSVSETFYDFGTISMKNGNVSKSFTITNNGADTKISKISTSCMCTNAFIVSADGSKKGPFGMPGHGGLVPKANEAIGAGESRTLEVVYDPNAHGPAGVGLIERVVFIEDENGKVVELVIRVNVRP